jgi:Sad1 / UNC-like C-terminal
MNHHSYLGRVRGRRVALLLASALPLLAVDDVAQQQQVIQQHLHLQHETILQEPLPFFNNELAADDDDDENDWNVDDDDLLIKKHVAQQDVLPEVDVGRRRRRLPNEAENNEDCTIVVGKDQQCLAATQRLLEDEALTSLPALMPLDNNFWMMREQETLASSSAVAAGTESSSSMDGVVRYDGNTVSPFRPFFDYDHRGASSSSSSSSSSTTTSSLEAAVHSNSSSNQNKTSTTSSSSSSTTTSTDGAIALSPSTNETMSLEVNTNKNETYVGNQTVSEKKEENTADTLAAITAATKAAAAATVVAPITDTDDDEPVIVDYASKSAGALILEKSAGWKGVSNLLNGDKDQYAMIPISNRNKSIVIGLSEDILLEQIVLANYERYSSHVRDFVVLGSQTMDTWVDLGTYTAKPGNGKKQRFDFVKPTWARYLKIIFLRHYGDEHYLTVSQISIHGRTMLQGFHEEWDEEEQLQQQEAAAAAAAASPENGAVANDAKTTDSGSAILINDQEAMDHHPAVQQNLCRTAKLQDGDCNGSLSFEKKMRLFSFLNHLESDALTNSAVYKNGRRRGIAIMATTRISAAGQVITEIPSTRVASTLFKKNSSSRNSSCGITMYNAGADVKIGFNMTSTPSRLIQTIRAKLRQQHGLAVKIPKIYKQHVPEPSLIALAASEATDQEGAIADENLPAEEATETKSAEAKSSSDPTRLVTAPSADSPGTDKKSQRDNTAPIVTGTAVADMDTSSPTSALPGLALADATTTPSVSSKNLADGGGKANQSTVASASAAKSSSTVTASTTATTTPTTATTTTTAAADDEADDAALQATKTALSKMLLERFPSASCLENLDFAQFKTKILQARPQRSQHGGSGTGNPGASMEPIFKKLTDEIRTLQTSLNVHDQFARESVACYQGLLLDLLAEQESLRHGHEERLARLEEDMRNNLAWLVAISRFLSPVTFIVKSILGCFVRGLYVAIPSIVSGLALSISTVMPRMTLLIGSIVDRNAATAAVDHFQKGTMELLSAAGGVLVLFIVVAVCAGAAGPVLRLRLRLAASSNGNSTMTLSTTKISTTAAVTPSNLPLKKQRQYEQIPPPPPPLAATPPSKQLPKQQPLQQISNRERKKKKQAVSNKNNHKETTEITNGMHCQ